MRRIDLPVRLESGGPEVKEHTLMRKYIFAATALAATSEPRVPWPPTTASMSARASARVASRSTLAPSLPNADFDEGDLRRTR